jgi:hypothetical protein
MLETNSQNGAVRQLNERTKNGLKPVTNNRRVFREILTGFLSSEVLHELVLYFHADHGSDEKQTSQALRLEDTEISYSCA